jgi:hypothetical protein
LVQLRQQSNVLRGEIERNKARDKLLDGQIRELQQREQVSQRQQADSVDLAWWIGKDVPVAREGPFTGDMGTILMVANRSSRPIRNVTCRILPVDGSAEVAGGVGLLQFDESDKHAGPRMVGAVPGSVMTVIRAGSSYGYIFSFEMIKHLDASLAARFTDDAGVHWQLDQDMHLVRLDDRTDW